MRSHQGKLQRTIYIGTFVLVLLLAIIAAIVWPERQSIPTAHPAEELRSITIQRPDYADISLQLDNAQWHLLTPCRAYANKQRIDAFKQLLTPASHSYAAAEVDLEAAGLENPLAIVTINGIALKIGATDLSGERRYVQRNTQIEFAPEWILSLIQGGTSAFAKLEVFSEALTSLTVSSDEANAQETISNVQQWQSLSANQVIAWPLTENIPELVKRYSVRYTSASETGQATISEFDAFSAIVKSDEHCAYIVSNNALPSL